MGLCPLRHDLPQHSSLAECWSWWEMKKLKGEKVHKRFLRDVKLFFFCQHPHCLKETEMNHWWWWIAIVTPKSLSFDIRIQMQPSQSNFLSKKAGEAPNQNGPCKNKKRNTAKKIRSWEDAIFHGWVFSSKTNILNPKSKFGRCSFSLRWLAGSSLIFHGGKYGFVLSRSLPPKPMICPSAPWPQLDVGWKSLLWTCRPSP